ncbi:MAG: hypothetical protein CL678_00890 [Bdellovibrionaceae bacterium]|nr:hypothetical protein [Pseudobdellovibrionaceae bacterium]
MCVQSSLLHDAHAWSTTNKSAQADNTCLCRIRAAAHPRFAAPYIRSWIVVSASVKTMSGNDDFLIFDTTEPTATPTFVPTGLITEQAQHSSVGLPLLLVLSIFVFVLFKIYTSSRTSKPKTTKHSNAPLLLTDVQSWIEEGEDVTVLGPKA